MSEQDKPLTTKRLNSTRSPELDNLRAALAQAERERQELRDALQEISDVLGTGGCKQKNCDGCEWEHEYAGGIARAALVKEDGSDG